MAQWTLQNYRDEFRAHVGVDEYDMDNTIVDRILNQSWWEIADTFNFREKETSRMYNTVAGTFSITAASDIEGLQQISIQDRNSSQHTLLEPMTLLTYETEFTDTTTSRGKPTHYVRRGSTIILYPTPDNVYEITEYYWKTLSDIAVGGVTIPQSWNEVILYGAVQRGFARLGDYNRSRAAKGMQMEIMGTKETVPTKERTDLHYAGVQMIRPRYP